MILFAVGVALGALGLACVQWVYDALSRARSRRRQTPEAQALTLISRILEGKNTAQRGDGEGIAYAVHAGWARVEHGDRTTRIVVTEDGIAALATKGERGESK